MTTIAFDGKTMACDTRVVCGSNCYNTDTKIYENEFVVIGVAGDAGVGILLVKDDGILVPKHYDFDFSALVWVKDIETLCKVEFYKSWDCALSSVIPIADGFAAVGVRLSLCTGGYGMWLFSTWRRSCCIEVRHQHRRQDYYQTTIRIIPTRGILQLLHT